MNGGVAVENQRISGHPVAHPATLSTREGHRLLSTEESGNCEDALMSLLSTHRVQGGVHRPRFSATSVVAGWEERVTCSALMVYIGLGPALYSGRYRDAGGCGYGLGHFSGTASKAFLR